MIQPFKIVFITLLLFQVYCHAQNDSIIGKVPVEELLKEYNQRNFRISPDGKLFLEIVRENFEDDIVIIDIDGYELKNRIPMKTDNLGEVVWLSNQRLLYEESGEIFAIDIDGTNKLKIIDGKAEKRIKNINKFYLNYRYNSILSLNAGDEDEILVEAFDGDLNAYVKKVNIYTGENTTILDGKNLKVNKWLADKTGGIHLGIRVEEKGWEYVQKDSRSDKWIPINLNIDGKSHPFKLEAKNFVEDNVLLVDTDFDSNVLYLASNLGVDKRHLIKYDLLNQKVLDTLVSDVNCDVSDDNTKDIQLLFDYKERKLGGVRYEGVLPKFESLTENFRVVKTKFDANYSNYINDIIDYSQDFKRIVFYQWSDTYEGNIGIYDVDSDEYYVMFQFNSELNKYKLSKTRIISLPSSDGYPLPAYLTLPHNYQEQDKIPLVVVPHGGPWARDSWGMDVYSQFFASNNYAVLRVNYRGSTGFGKKHFQAGIEGIGSTMITDVVSATKEVMKRYKIDENAVFIYGHSYGGYVTYMALANHPNLFKAGVAVAAPTDIKEMMKFQKKEGNNFSLDYWRYVLGNNGSNYYKEVSPINYVEKINAPLLVFHGNLDLVVPAEQALAMEMRFNKLNKKNASFRIVRFLGHSLEDSNSHGYILKESEEFFRNSLTK